MSRILNWMVTPNGRTTVGILASVTTCSVFAAHYVPDTFLLKNYYYDFVTMRKHGKPIPLTPSLEILVDRVETDLDLTSYQKQIIKPFMIFGFDVWHAGSLSSKFGSLIGIPINFTYTDPSSIDKDGIIVNNEKVNWNRDDAKQLLESLVISDDAKKYAIGREILMTNNSNLVLEAITASFLVGGCYGFAAHMNDSLNNWQKPRSFRIIFYALVTSFFWGLWTMQKDAMTRFYESQVDEHLSQLGSTYINGAVEFYNQLAKRNSALRTLLGANGKQYTANGNETILIRQKHLPISYRKQFFEDKLKSKETPDQKNIAAA